MVKKFIENLIRKFAPKVKEEIKELATEGVEKLKDKIADYDYSEKLEAVAEVVVNKIKLPLWLKPFRKVIKKVIIDTVEGLIEEGKEKLHN